MMSMENNSNIDLSFSLKKLSVVKPLEDIFVLCDGILLQYALHIYLIKKYILNI